MYDPSPEDFWFVMTKKSIYVLNGQYDDQRKVANSLELHWLETPEYGGIEDLGNFDEGFCFRL